MNPRMLTIQSNGQRALLYPELGFQIFGYECDFQGETVPVIYSPSQDFEPETRWYGNPVLFPAPSISWGDGKVNHWSREGKTYAVAQHGIARNSYWQVSEIHPDRVVAELRYHSAMAITFPHPFLLRGEYSLGSNGLTLRIDVSNPGEKPFPYGMGFHPYFCVPLGKNGKKNECFIQLPEGKRVFSTDNWKTVQDKPYAANKVYVSSPDLKNTIVLEGTGADTLWIEDPRQGRKLRISTSRSEQAFPLWAIWCDSLDSHYLCVEPWSARPGMLAREDTLQCQPGETQSYTLDIKLETP